MNRPQINDRILYVGHTKIGQAIVVRTHYDGPEENHLIIRWYLGALPLEGPVDQEQYLGPTEQKVFLDEFVQDIRDLGFLNLNG